MSKPQKSTVGYLDLTLTDSDNMPIYKSRGKGLSKAIRDFEKFLEEKYGIRGFSAHEKRK